MEDNTLINEQEYSSLALLIDKVYKNESEALTDPIEINFKQIYDLYELIESNIEKGNNVYDTCRLASNDNSVLRRLLENKYQECKEYYIKILEEGENKEYYSEIFSKMIIMKNIHFTMKYGSRMSIILNK